LAFRGWLPKDRRIYLVRGSFIVGARRLLSGRHQKPGGNREPGVALIVAD
jgi:hypothetical protein